MFYISVELPHVRDIHTFRGVSGFVAKKGTRYPGMSTNLFPYFKSEYIVFFESAKRARNWAKKNIMNPRAIVVVHECYNT